MNYTTKSPQRKLCIVAVLLTGFMSGCGTVKEYVPVETVRTEKETVTKWRTDTIVDRDTVKIAQKGDTVFAESVKWRWRVKEVRDTAIVELRDSVAVPYPVETVREVPRKRRWWETALLCTGAVALFLAGRKCYMFVKGIRSQL